MKESYIIIALILVVSIYCAWDYYQRDPNCTYSWTQGEVCR